MACLYLSEEGRKALCLLFELFEIRDYSCFLCPQIHRLHFYISVSVVALDELSAM